MRVRIETIISNLNVLGAHLEYLTRPLTENELGFMAGLKEAKEVVISEYKYAELGE